MSELNVGSWVRVVSFDEEGITGDVYAGENSLVGLEGLVVGVIRDQSGDFWIVKFPEDIEEYVPGYFLTDELEVIEEPQAENVPRE